MRYSYKTENTCSTEVAFDLDEGIVHNIDIAGGCSGNIQALEKLLDGFTVEDLQEKCGGIICGRRGTSCADQLSIAVGRAMEDKNKGS